MLIGKLRIQLSRDGIVVKNDGWTGTTFLIQSDIETCSIYASKPCQQIGCRK